MLHALLHRKLDETNPEPQRLEDALTSTVFGTLSAVDAWDLIAAWLELPQSQRDSVVVNDIWFWPRLSEAEPDVVLRVAGCLVVIEAKYRSGRHDVTGSADIEPAISDQLVRQFRSVTTPCGARPLYPDLLEQAIGACELTQVLLVDSRRIRRAWREFEESRSRLPATAVLKIITWQRLFRLLDDKRSLRWAVDLRAYLSLAGLDTFTGINRVWPDRARVAHLTGWRARERERWFRSLRYSHAATALSRNLLMWRGAGKRSRGPQLLNWAHWSGILDASSTIRSWRMSGQSRISQQRRGRKP